MPGELSKHLSLLEFLRQDNPPAQKKAILAVLTSAQTVAIAEICLNILHGVIPLSELQKRNLSKYKNLLRELGYKGPLQDKRDIMVKHVGALTEILNVVSGLLATV